MVDQTGDRDRSPRFLHPLHIRESYLPDALDMSAKRLFLKFHLSTIVFVAGVEARDRSQTLAHLLNETTQDFTASFSQWLFGLH